MDKIRPRLKTLVADDGTRLKYREWNPAKVKGAVICLHGVRSHGAWYLGSSSYLFKHGYRVIFPDRRGSGLNKEAVGGAVRFHKWIGDTESFIAMAGRELGRWPIHLMGISMGARVAVAVAARGRFRLSSLVLSAPGIVPLIDYPLTTKLAILLALLYNKKREFILPLDNPALFTDDPDEQNYIDGDGLGLRRASARFLLECSRLERAAKRKVAAIGIPVFLLFAGRDQIVDNEAVKKLFAGCKSADKVIKTYPEARHTLEFDACREEYFRDLVRWLDKHSYR